MTVLVCGRWYRKAREVNLEACGRWDPSSLCELRRDAAAAATYTNGLPGHRPGLHLEMFVITPDNNQP